MQHLIELIGREAHQGLTLGDLPLRPAASVGLGHVDGHLQCRGTGALAHPGLQHPELALFDGELGVAHVGVVPLEPVEDLDQVPVDRREVQLHVVEVLGVADAGHDIFALGVDQEVAVGLVLARGSVAGEAHAGAGVVVAVTEHHGLHRDRGAQVVADPLACAVGNGASTVPALEDGLDRAA